jgi:hypothetical protein
MWRTLPVAASELHLGTVLQCGQSFLWRRTSVDPETWSGVVDGRLLSLRHTAKGAHCSPVVMADETEQVLRRRRTHVCRSG